MNLASAILISVCSLHLGPGLQRDLGRLSSRRRPPKVLVPLQRKVHALEAARTGAQSPPSSLGLQCRLQLLAVDCRAGAGLPRCGDAALGVGLALCSLAGLRSGVWGVEGLWGCWWDACGTGGMAGLPRGGRFALSLAGPFPDVGFDLLVGQAAQDFLLLSRRGGVLICSRLGLWGVEVGVWSMAGLGMLWWTCKRDPPLPGRPVAEARGQLLVDCIAVLRGRAGGMAV